MNAEITFRVRAQDLSKAARLIMVNRGATKDSDFVDFLVSECVATLRSVGASTEIPIHGIAMGTGRIPITAFEKIAGVARSFRKGEAQVVISDGSLRVGSWRYQSDAITVGTIPDQEIDLPVNASTIDTLALAELLNPDELIQQGFHRRVRDAREVASEAISRATIALKPLAISREQLKELVDEHVRKASRSLSKALTKNGE